MLGLSEIKFQNIHQTVLAIVEVVTNHVALLLHRLPRGCRVSDSPLVLSTINFQPSRAQHRGAPGAT